MPRVVRQLGIATAICAVFTGSSPARIQAQSVDQTFKSSVDLVTIQASVRDRRGRPVSGLSPGDFEVRDNGELRPVISVRADDRSSLSLAVLVDMSGSMSFGPKVEMARHAFDTLLAQLRTGDDELGVFTFDSSLHQRHAFGTDLSSFAHALDDLEPYGTTSLFDATAEVARKLAGRSATRKALLLITDGIDTSSQLSVSEVSAVASAIDVPVFVVAAVPATDERTMMEATARSPQPHFPDLRDLAEWTGGRFIFASTFQETTTAAGSLVNELRQQYVLAIEAAGSREWRRLDVRVKQRAATSVRARSGYFGG